MRAILLAAFLACLASSFARGGGSEEPQSQLDTFHGERSAISAALFAQTTAEDVIVVHNKTNQLLLIHGKTKALLKRICLLPELSDELIAEEHAGLLEKRADLEHPKTPAEGLSPAPITFEPTSPPDLLSLLEREHKELAVERDYVVVRERKIRVEYVPILGVMDRSAASGEETDLPRLPLCMVVFYVEEVAKILSNKMRARREITRRRLEVAFKEKCKQAHNSYADIVMDVWRWPGVRGVYKLRAIGEYMYLSKITVEPHITDAPKSISRLLSICMYVGTAVLFLSAAFVPAARLAAKKAEKPHSAILVASESRMRNVFEGTMHRKAVSILVLSAGDPAYIEKLRAISRGASSLEHPNVLHILHEEISSGFTHLAFEKCSMTLSQFIRSSGANRSALVPEEGGDIVKLMREVVMAVCHIHDRGYVHLNITPDTVYIKMRGARPMAVLAGLESTCELFSADAEAPAEEGEREYRATGWESPGYIRSVLGKETKRNKDHDFYSLGCILHFMARHTHPFENFIRANLKKHTSGEEADDYEGLIRQARETPIGNRSYFFGCVNGRKKWAGKKFVDRKQWFPSTDGGSWREKGGQTKVGGPAAQRAMLYELDDLVAHLVSMETREHAGGQSWSPSIDKGDLLRKHVFFWSAKEKFEFLAHLSDCDIESSSSYSIDESALFKEKEGGWPGWEETIPPALMDELTTNGKRGRYRCSSLGSLYRLFRNGGRHFYGLEQGIRKDFFGDSLCGYVSYFHSLFPFLSLFSFYTVFLERKPDALEKVLDEASNVRIRQ